METLNEDKFCLSSNDKAISCQWVILWFEWRVVIFQDGHLNLAQLILSILKRGPLRCSWWIKAMSELKQFLALVHFSLHPWSSKTGRTLRRSDPEVHQPESTDRQKKCQKSLFQSWTAECPGENDPCWPITEHQNARNSSRSSWCQIETDKCQK